MLFCVLVRGEKCSLRHAVDHYSYGQAPTKQEYHQEEEGGGGGAKRFYRWPIIFEECDL